MIAVDLFADLYSWGDQDRERGRRAAGAARTIHATVRGASGAAAGPTVFIDAALAVLDALGAYARFRQAREVTRQLEIEGDTLRQLLGQLDKQLKIDLEVADHESGAKLESLRLRLRQHQQAIKIDASQFAALSRQVKTLGQLIASQRTTLPPNCTTMASLEKTYYQLVDAQLQMAMTSVKE